jgi:NitT/TauT family transport system substrate-binding protein
MVAMAVLFIRIEVPPWAQPAAIMKSGPRAINAMPCGIAARAERLSPRGRRGNIAAAATRNADGGSVMKKTILAALAVLLAGTSASFAVEKLKVAIPQRGFWDSSWVEFGEAAGYFKDAGLEVEVFYTEGGAQTIATVASGSVDIAMSNGILGAVGAYVKGGESTPYRIISAEMTGANELFWWVKADSPIKSLKDADGKTIAFSSPGSSSNLILLTLLHQLGSKAKPVPTGGVPGTYTQTMTGQIDIGWSVVPFALKDINEGKVRIVARASEAAELKDQTIRANLASVNALKNRREAITKFMQVIQKSIDWAYGEGHNKAVEIFAKNMKVTPEIAKQAVDGFYPKSAMQIGEIKGLDRSLKDALDFKFIASPKTPQDVAGLFDIVYKPK